MAEEAVTPPKKDAPVAHAPSWMVKAFGMEDLVKSGAVVEEPSPGVTVVQVGKQLIPIPPTPPKSEWKKWSVLIESGVAYRRVVLAPTAGDAMSMVDDLIDEDDDAIHYDNEEELTGGYCEVNDGSTDEVPDEVPDFEWEPPEKAEPRGL